MPELTSADWDTFLGQYPNAHLLQTTAWGELKDEFGWQPVRLAAGSTGVQVLFRRLPLGFTLAYIPKGPLGQDWNHLCPEVDAICRQKQAIYLKVEPDLWQSDQEQLTPPEGFISSPQNVQPPRTILIDISGDEERILGEMKQKTRYNIKLALKKGVVVFPSADIDTFHRLLRTTGKRDGFAVHSLAYYRRAYELFHPRGGCELLMAEYEGEPLAGLMVFAHGRRAWYFYGASASDHRDRMPTYLLQWEAIRWARSHGCQEYDLWGIPDENEDTLENGFTQQAGGLWGVYRFKRGFGGQICRSTGPWDRVYKPFLYKLFQSISRRRSI